MTIPTSPAPPLIHLLTSDALPHAPETSNISWFNYLLNAPSIKTPSNACSGLMKPDTLLGENTRQIEVSDDQTTPYLFR